VFIVVRIMCNLRLSAKEKNFCVKVRFRIGKIARVSKKTNSFQWQFHGRTQTFELASVFKCCETAVEDRERTGRPSKRHVQETWKKALKIIK